MLNKKMKQALEYLQQGKIIIVTDDENRENEADLICATEFATTENINFMATYAKGLICMPISQSLADKLDFHPMVTNNTDNHQTAFTVSIDHTDTQTGISAKERSMTALHCIHPQAKPSDFRRPGHMFPLVAKEHGVLERDGHTEATVDLLKLSGLEECGICCEMMADNGEMMTKKEIVAFAQKWQLPCLSVKDIQDYRKQTESLIECVSINQMPTAYGDFELYTFIDKITDEHHIALVKGDLNKQQNVLCRVHSECLTGDVFGSLRCDCGEQFANAMKQINQANQGVLIYMRQEGRGIGFVNKMKAYQLQEKGLDTVEANLSLGFKDDLREYYVSAQILNFLHIQSIQLLTNNPDKVAQLSDYGIQITKRKPIVMASNQHNKFYLNTKQNKMGHTLKMEEYK